MTYEPIVHVPDAKLDLTFERIVDLPPELIWRAWTTPDLLKQWFCPRPWQTVECDIDLRPGGRFYTVMRSPEGQRVPNIGCYLEVIDERKLVWTNAVGPGYRPRAAGTEHGLDFAFTAVVTLDPVGTGTCYTALVIHGDETACRRHEQMGFHQGWGIALDQLLEVVNGMD